jgi:hypothetical protein
MPQRLQNVSTLLLSRLSFVKLKHSTKLRKNLGQHLSRSFVRLFVCRKRKLEPQLKRRHDFERLE